MFPKGDRFGPGLSRYASLRRHTAGIVVLLEEACSAWKLRRRGQRQLAVVTVTGRDQHMQRLDQPL